MNRLLILDGEAPIYQAELGNKALPNLKIDIAQDVEMAAPLLPEVEIIFGTPALVAEVVHRAPLLKWVQSTYAGVEQLCQPDLPRSYLLTGIKGLFGSFMREYVFAYILARERSLIETHENQRQKIWSRINYRSLKNVTIGIVGLGSIGAQVARTAQHFEMRVLGMTRTASQIDFVDHHYMPNEMDDFLPQLDYIVLVLPDTPESRCFVSAEELALLPPEAVLINVGRGSSINQSDLVNALESGQISGAVLDVFEQEPLPDDSPLWAMENVMITPHNSAYSFPDQIADIFAANYARYIVGSPLDYLVDFNRGY